MMPRGCSRRAREVGNPVHQYPRAIGALPCEYKHVRVLTVVGDDPLMRVFPELLDDLQLVFGESVAAECRLH